jgi:glucosamine--fructose-6-phosphate aminotransferase (isomerizing)
MSAGQHTLGEILSQPEVWRACLDEISRAAPPALDGEVVLIGCGSSYYLALAAAAAWTELTGQRARALPASEVLLYPDLVLGGNTRLAPILITRSGTTSEVIRAAEFLEIKANVRTAAITCSSGRPIEKASSTTIRLPAADEKSFTMTRSFTSMLIGLMDLAARRAGRQEFRAALERLPEEGARLLPQVQRAIDDKMAGHGFANYVFLGQGPLFGIASEAMLKVMEMSCSAAQCFHTLEFRHGPKATARPGTLVTFFLSGRGRSAELEVLQEVKALEARTLVITHQGDPEVRRASDYVFELPTSLPELARGPLFLFVPQLLGCLTGIKKGLNPDQPPHLSRSVVL